ARRRAPVSMPADSTTRSTRCGKPRACGKGHSLRSAPSPHERPRSRSRSLLREEGAGFCQNLLLALELRVLPTERLELLLGALPALLAHLRGHVFVLTAPRIEHVFRYAEALRHVLRRTCPTRVELPRFSGQGLVVCDQAASRCQARPSRKRCRPVSMLSLVRAAKRRRRACC